jgi:hypothetical protein
MDLVFKLLGAAAYAAAERYLANSPGVVRLTFSSVDWADRIVATSSSNAELWFRAQFTGP